MLNHEYLLTCLMEECAEVIKECSKSLRFGLKSKGFIVDASNNPTNAQCISDELNDVFAVAVMLEGKKNIPGFRNNNKMSEKQKKLKRYMKLTR